MARSGRVPLDIVDGLGRSLPMVAVLHGQQDALQLLLDNAGELNLDSGACVRMYVVLQRTCV